MMMKNNYLILILIFSLIFTKPAETSISDVYFFIKEKAHLFLSDKTNTKIKNNKLNASTLRILSNKIHEYYDKLFHQNAFNGCVLVAIGDKIIYENALGYNDFKKTQCLNTNSLFQLASVSKIFTATAILKLYEKKMLDINDYVIKYIPEFPYKDVKISHLLNHTAGLPNYLHLMSEIGRQDTILSHEAVLQFLCQKRFRQEFRTGRRHKYCNTNYAVLACLIERVSGMKYSDFLKKEIFIPAQMNSTNTIYYIDVFDENTTLSREYKTRSVPFYAGDFILGDKSIYSNIHDLFNFSQSFLNGKILNDTLIELMTKGVKTNRYGMLYGYGIRIKNHQDSSKTIWFHNGWWHGYRTSFQMRPKDKVTVIVLSNHIHKTTYYTEPIYQTIDEVLYNVDNNFNPTNSQQKVYPELDDE